MNTPVTIITTGRVTADLELKTSQNGRNTKFVQFSLAVNKGYGENNRPNYYKCLLFGEEAQRIIDAKVKKGSLIQIVGDWIWKSSRNAMALPAGVPESHCCPGTMLLLTARRKIAFPKKIMQETTSLSLPKTVVRMACRLIKKRSQEELQKAYPADAVPLFMF